ncbi:DNA-3-methyladenine glycosylase I [Aureimonas phyllosphaerae]|uniref:DNA-3-methyladenine glycosylase I n=1 Tax=Aureimonas phyllosphaerae TaxID=1166078 RepID=A0A7W6BRN0_9HYPH|nr:DNA-3-methyladenine glycosylase I [Aureimonas phyllosphaerae]MBB3936814.1 DNA-3-methyladenine glycosylase I [Aureimonas phyllosphaerae]MBB3961071.1 DNA-3-methyladenine glycosylase I [Aureimonas phyllosphaerae]SFF26190.1 DNA-3-methyladenine glycosylase I [Aureimonas phyllosphaerae]
METTAEGLRIGADGAARCAWAGEGADYVAYHDREWGRPSADDDQLYEKICLEGFQSGLSWITILRKREAFRRQFAGFAIEAVAEMGEADVERILADPGVVRHRGKIASAINNARAARRLRDETGASLAAFLWRFEPPAEERPGHVTLDWARANPQTPASQRLAKALKAKGFTFFGPTTAYAFMQSMGFVNDHLEGCCIRDECEQARAAFVRPA